VEEEVGFQRVEKRKGGKMFLKNQNIARVLPSLPPSLPPPHPQQGAIRPPRRRWPLEAPLP
jgi:hypothetical protein